MIEEILIFLVTFSALAIVGFGIGLVMYIAWRTLK